MNERNAVLKKIEEQVKVIREELEDILERRVHLKLFVKVKENWSEMPETLRLIGLME